MAGRRREAALKIMKNLTLHVASSGNDTWSGTRPTPNADQTDGPLATLIGARDALRRLREPSRPESCEATVIIQDGLYPLAEPLLFDACDSGTAAAPVCYRAAEGAAPMISGGSRISEWEETVHNGKRCWIADLPEVADGTWNFNRLYVGNRPRSRPRLPKQGTYHFTGMDDQKDSGFKWHKGPDRANFAPGEICGWRNLEDVEVKCFQLWFEMHHRIRSIDVEKNLVHFQTASMGSLRDERGDFARYYVENVFEALDEPGQWYLDRPTGRLFYLPLPGETVETTTVVAPRLDELLRLSGSAENPVAHLHFENLTFAHQTWQIPSDCNGYVQAAFGVPGAIVTEGAADCVFYGCRVEHVSGYGFEFLVGSTRNTLAACTITDTGAGGVKIGHESLSMHSSAVGEDFEPAEPMPPIATMVTDCTIRDCGHLFPSAVGIWIGNSGWNQILHNRIADCNYTGISCGWTWGYTATRTAANRIENNHIHHINHREILSDNGGIYTLGQQPGTVLRGNVLHDISCYGYGAWGIYLDEGSSEIRVEHNLVCGTKKAAVNIHYGRDNLIQQNILALSAEDHLSMGKREGHRSVIVRKNIFLPESPHFTGNWDAAHWTFSDNLCWPQTGEPPTFVGEPLSALQAKGQGDGCLVADPLCADVGARDFALRSGSPALALGFQSWDWSDAGPRLRHVRPAAFSEYAREFPLPVREVPIIRARIEALESASEAFSTGRANFELVLSNVGNAPTSGSLRLTAGPTGSATIQETTVAFALSPGDESREKVSIEIEPEADLLWVETEPLDEHSLPTRSLLYHPDASTWRIAASIDSATSRRFRHGGRAVAEIKLAAADTGLQVEALYFQRALAPNLEAPWKGTALEFIAYKFPAEGPPLFDLPERRQVCLVPQETNIAVRSVRDGTIAPAPDVRATCEAMDNGWKIRALIPWKEFGFSSMPTSFPFDIIVDVPDPVTNNITQLPLFNLPASGWKRGFGQLEIEV